MLVAFGDEALRFRVPERRGKRGLLDALRAVDGARDVVLTEETGCLIWRRGAVRDLAAIAAVLDHQEIGDVEEVKGREHRVLVVYDGEDLDDVALAIGRSREEVIELHSRATYRVAMLGFMPGFAYMRGLPPELVLPRRAPRARVPPGSVAIAAEYAGIYPFASPGGWNLLGRAASFDAFREDGHAAFAIGDGVTFVPTTTATTSTNIPASERIVMMSRVPDDRPHLEITRAAGFAISVRDCSGRMHEGIPPGGPLVRSACARANRLLGNSGHSCAIEIVGSLEATARNGTVAVSSDGDQRVDLKEGDAIRIETGPRRVRYLAIEGGVHAPFVPGPARMLKRGDRILPDEIASSISGTQDETEEEEEEGEEEEEEEHHDVIEILRGPDVVDGAWELLTSRRPFRISSSSNRTGVRLEDSALSSTSSLQKASAPMVIGAIELTPAGLIVLGPDHPTTGGYPVVAVLRSKSLDSFFATPIGGSICFSEGS
jgi:KipI family sensor histidine kinase inhibitor